MIDVRCKGCNRLLGKFVTVVGAIKCPRSGTMGKIQGDSNLTNVLAKDALS